MTALGYVFGFGYGAFCLIGAFLLSALGVAKNITRKLVHIFIGFEWVILYIFHGATYHFLIVCLAFLSLLVFAYKKKLLKMISSDGDNAPGTVYYAVSMSVMALVTMLVPEFMLPFGVAVFATSFGDGLAGLVGQLARKFNPKIYKAKTLLGTLANFVFSSVAALVFALVFPELNLEYYHCIMIGALAAGVELVSGFGLDNIFLPLSVFVFTYFLSENGGVDIMSYAVPILVTPPLVAFVTERRALKRSGVIAALILDVAVSVSLCNSGFVLLLSFLMIGILTDKLKRKDAEKREEKSSCRDAAQVFANGLIPMLLSLLYLVTSHRAFAFAYAVALAEALGDTAASSLGSYSHNTFDVFRLRRCAQGISGGVSVIGTLSALAFSGIMCALAGLLGVITLTEALYGTAVAFAGTLFDSLLGSLLQAKYTCRVCGSLTERKAHCGQPTRRVSGVRIINNDAVNALSTLFTGAVAVIFYLYII